MRLFYAVEIPNRVKAALGRLQRLGGSEGGDYRWVNPSSMHVTLAFLGERAEGDLKRLREIGAKVAARERPFQLAIGHLGTFGSPRAPRVLWAGVAGNVAWLGELQTSLAGELRDAGFPLEERRFSPHITLARRRERARQGTPVNWPPKAGALPDLSFAVDDFVLMSSELSPMGPRYAPLERFELAG